MEKRIIAVNSNCYHGYSIEQAIERAGSKAGNKGFDTVCAAIETANVLRALN